MFTATEKKKEKKRMERMKFNSADLLPGMTDIKAKVEAATTIRDNLDHYTTGQIYPAFLKKLMPVFLDILRGAPTFQSTSYEQVRNPSPRKQRKHPPKKPHYGSHSLQKMLTSHGSDYESASWRPSIASLLPRPLPNPSVPMPTTRSTS